MLSCRSLQQQPIWEGPTDEDSRAPRHTGLQALPQNLLQMAALIQAVFPGRPKVEPPQTELSIEQTVTTLPQKGQKRKDWPK